MRGARTAFAGTLVALTGLLVPFTAPATAGGAGQVATARAATHDFTRPAQAKGAGYGLLKDAHGIACISMMGMGGMGVHYANGALVGDGKIQVRHPEALVYRFTVNGHLKLAALEYLVLRTDWRAHHADRATDALRPPVQPDAGRQPVRTAGVLLAARLGVGPQPGRPVPDVEPDGALPRGHLTGGPGPTTCPAHAGTEVTGRVVRGLGQPTCSVSPAAGRDEGAQASSASTSTS